jgi:hypothetical protein
MREIGETMYERGGERRCMRGVEEGGLKGMEREGV